MTKVSAGRDSGGFIEPDPLALLSSVEFAAAMRMSAAELEEADRKGQVFYTSLSRNGEPFAGYLALQSLVSRDAMAAIIAALRPTSGRDSYLFLISLNRDLDWLAPAELMLGRKLGERRVCRDGWRLLRARKADRLAFVVAAARVAATVRDGW
jgi:hypothetical protein